MTKLEKLAKNTYYEVRNCMPEVLENDRASVSWEDWMIEFSKKHPIAWKKYFAKIFPGYKLENKNLYYVGI